jgi:hypothetical protein
LTTQVPVRSVYLTSGRSRKMHLGKQVVELRHAPRWQLALANRPAGEAVRALAWLGPERAESHCLGHACLSDRLPHIMRRFRTMGSGLRRPDSKLWPLSRDRAA